MIISKLPLSNQQLNIATTIAKELNLEIRVAKILVNKGITTVEQAKSFIFCGKNNFYSPYLIQGISQAKDKILQAVKDKKRILIFGDYDADGICATSIMYYTFKELGVQVDTFIPEREQGYGITDKSLDIILQKPIDLLITVDCGISCVKEVDLLLSKGIDVIVTDHHELPEILPNTININCKIKSDYPFNNLCGAGVAYKLSYALIGEKANSLLDFVALATVADSMELVGENRDLVAEGLKLFKNPRPQFKALMELGKAKEVSSGMLAFNIAPKVNACGRMGNAKLGLKLMLSQDLAEIYQIAEELISYNQERQSVCESLYLSAKQKLAETDLNSAVITLYDESWHGGLVGIVAAKIAEEYNRPTIMFAKTEDGLKGSARSIEGVNLYQAIEACSSYLLGFGGHSQAAGVSILQENLGAFNSALNSYVCKFFGDKFVKQTVVEEFIKEPITILEGKQLSLLEPFGTGNKKPIFAIRGDSFKINRLSGEHISLKTDYLDLLYFNGLSKAEELGNSYTKSIVVELNYSVFNNKESVKGFVKNYEVVLQDDIKDSLVLFQTYLEGLLQEDMPCEMAEKEHIDDFIDKFLALPYGTIFAVADPKNLQYYTKLKNLPIEFSFNLTDNLLNKIVVGYKGENKYKQVVYLDNSPAFKSGIKCTTIKPFADLTLDRNSVARVFGAFNNVYKSVEDLICKNPSLNPYELVFAYCVLKELKIINHNQYIVKDSSVKNQITNSKIYNKFQTR